MKIRMFAVGNDEEAFIENRFLDGINIISSDDNNKGKTIVLQSIMYALGNEPIFPSSFKYKDYYHYLEYVRADGKIVAICRKKDSYVIRYNNSLHIFDSLSEFKHYMNEEQFSYPIILKDGMKKLVDPMLLYQVFFVGQDNKDTSNIFLKGYYNKGDFINMIYSIKGINPIDSIGESDTEIKRMINSLKGEKKELSKQYKILESVLDSVSIASKSNDKSKFEDKIKKIEIVKNQIIGLSKSRNNSLARKTKNEITLKELRSLNRTLSVGQLTCLDCNSKNIGYSTADESYTFDISSTEIRGQILNTITNRISAYDEEINSLNLKINKMQDELQELLVVDEVSLESLLLFKNDIVDASRADTTIIEIDNKISELEIALKEKTEDSEDVKKKKQKLLGIIVTEMNEFYRKLEPSGNITYDGIFSTKSSVYSGCEETEFYLSKVLALKKVLKHSFPIVIDSFRDGELSSKKEALVIDEFNNLDCQVILTVTLKDEEIGKYNNMSEINHMNYIEHKPYKLLNKTYCDEFNTLLQKLSLSI